MLTQCASKVARRVAGRQTLDDREPEDLGARVAYPVRRFDQTCLFAATQDAQQFGRIDAPDGPCADVREDLVLESCDDLGRVAGRPQVGAQFVPSARNFLERPRSRQMVADSSTGSNFAALRFPDLAWILSGRQKLAGGVTTRTGFGQAHRRIDAEGQALFPPGDAVLCVATSARRWAATQDTCRRRR